MTDSKLIPSAHSSDQEEIMAGREKGRMRIASPPFSSYDPKSEARRMLPVEDDNSAADASGAEQSAVEITDYDAMKVPQLKELVAGRGLETEGNKKDHLVAALKAADAEDLKAADFKAAIEAATNQEELDAAAELYGASEKEYSTVEAALEAKQAELDGNQ